jgi:hypothetical protein
MDTRALKLTKLIRRVKDLFRSNFRAKTIPERTSTPASDIVEEEELVDDVVYNNTFEFGPIYTGTTIRILTLYPGKANDPLEGTLTHVDLDTSLVFKALSYVWGDSPKRESFTCDSKSVFFTVSLCDPTSSEKSRVHFLEIRRNHTRESQNCLSSRAYHVSLVPPSMGHARGNTCTEYNSFLGVQAQYSSQDCIL